MLVLALHRKQEISSGNTTIICSRETVFDNQKWGKEGLMIDGMMVYCSFSLPLNCIACQSDDCLLRHTQINPASHSLRSSPHWRIHDCDEARFWLTCWGQRGKPNNVTSFMSGAYWQTRHDSLEETSALSVKCERKLGCVCLYRRAASVVGGVRMRLKELCLHVGRAGLNKNPYPCLCHADLS